MQRKFVLGGALIAAGLVFLLVNGVQQSVATHMDLSALLQRAEADERIQLGGNTVVPGSIEWGQYRSRPEFQITDGERQLKVQYVGNAVLPDTFKDKAQVVLEGHYDPDKNVFEAQVVFAKCPSKYEGQSYEGHIQAMNADT